MLSFLGIISMSITFYPEEEKVREKWKKYFYFTLLLVSLSTLLEFVFQNQVNPSQNPRSTAVIIFGFAVLFGTLIVRSIPLFLLYYFAYKHSGTKFLTFNIIMALLQIPAFLEEWRKVGEESFEFLLIFIALFLYCIFFIRISWKLRKVNKAFRKRAKQEPQVSLEPAN